MPVLWVDVAKVVYSTWPFGMIGCIMYTIWKQKTLNKSDHSCICANLFKPNIPFSVKHLDSQKGWINICLGPVFMDECVCCLKNCTPVNESIE